jgi:hypothetical protein
MNEINSYVQSVGYGDIIVENKNGDKKIYQFKNAILKTGREAIVKSLTHTLQACSNANNGFEYAFPFFIKNMLFGNGGEVGGVPRVVNQNQSGLYGVTVASKAVNSLINPNNSTQAIFTSVLTFNDGNGYTINEIGLQMGSNDLYSLSTFSGIAKTSQIQITFNWNINIL